MKHIRTIFHKNDDTKICNKCGHTNPDDNKFCENCGNLFPEGKNETIEEDVSENGNYNNDNKEEATKKQEGEEAKSKTKKSKKKLIISMIVTAIMVAIAVVVLLIYLDNKNMGEYNAKIDEADRYMEELDYNKAEAVYLEAIEIEPKEPEAYVKTADVYVAQEQYQKAEEILEKGEKQAGGKDIEEKLEQIRPYGIYDEYLKNTLVPEIGLADVDEELTYYTLTPGLLSALIEDFDRDNIPDLLTVEYGSDESTVLTFSLYSCVNEKVELLDEMENDYEDYLCNAVQYDVFLKEHEDSYYIVIGYEGLFSEGGGQCTEIYKIDKVLQQTVDVRFSNDLGFASYSINGEKVSQYDYSNDLSSADTGRMEEVDAKGISKFESALSKYGFTRERFTETYNGFLNCSHVKYDEKESSERYICYIQHGIYYEDGSIDLIDMGATRYLMDYTGLRNRIESQ